MAEDPPYPKRPRTEAEKAAAAGRIHTQLQEMVSGIESLRREVRIVKENQKGLDMKLKKLEDNQANIAALVKDVQRSNFKIRDGPYEVRKCFI